MIQQVRTIQGIEDILPDLDYNDLDGKGLLDPPYEVADKLDWGSS
jgi:hypothetical protein